MSWIFHSIADEMVRTVNALRVEVGLKILTGFVTKCNDSLSSSPECSCLLSTARNPFTSRVSECLPYYVLLTWSCTPPCPSVISLIANWLMPGFTSALSWAWWSVVWCSSTAGLSQVTSSRKHKWNYTILFQCAFISSNVPIYVQTQLSDLSFCLLLMQGSRHKNELEASPSLIADLKSPETITLYRLIYSLLTLRDFDSYSVNTLSYPLSSIVNDLEHVRGHTWAPSVILILLISQNQNLSHILMLYKADPSSHYLDDPSGCLQVWVCEDSKVKEKRVSVLLQ